MLRDSLLKTCVNREKSLLCSPVKLLDMVAAERVNHGSNRGGLTSARVIKVQHSLDGTRLETIYKGSCGSVKGFVGWTSHRASLGIKTDEKIRRLSTFSVRVDRSHSFAGLVRSGASLGRWSIRLDRLEPINTNVRLVFGRINTKSKRDDLGDVRVWAKHPDGYAQALSEQTHGFETLLVIRATTTNKDFDLVSDQLALELLESADNPFEGSGNVGKIGDTTTDDEDLSLGVRRATGDKVN